MHAADTDQKENRIVVRHYDGIIELRNGAGQVTDTKRLQSNLRYDLRRTDTAIITIEQTNPLLFTYAWKVQDPTDTASYKAAKEFASIVAKVVEALQGLIPEEKQMAMSDITDYCANLSAAKAPNDALLCKAGVTRSMVAALLTQTNKVHERAAEIPQLIKRSAVSWDDAKAVRQKATGEWADTAEIIKAITTQYAALAKARRQRASREEQSVLLIATLDHDTIRLMAQNPTGTGGTLPPPTGARSRQSTVTATGSDEPLSHEVALLMEDKPTVDTDIAALQQFTALAAKIGDPVAFDAVAYNAKQDQAGDLSITAVPNPPDEAKKYVTGKFSIAFHPGGPVVYDYGLAAMYSFLEVPEFSAKAGDDGKLHIVRTDNGDAVSGTTAAPTLTITPRAWDDPQFSAGFQLGLSPLQDKIGLFVGSRIRIYDLFTFGAGIAYQQTKRLARNVSIGDIVEAADKIKTTNKFKPAAYVSIGIEITKKK